MIEVIAARMAAERRISVGRAQELLDELNRKSQENA